MAESGKQIVKVIFWDLNDTLYDSKAEKALGAAFELRDDETIEDYDITIVESLGSTDPASVNKECDLDYFR